MSRKLYLTELSPPARSVLLTAAAIGLKLEHVKIDLGKEEQLKPDFLKLNPQHTIPTLIDDDDFVIWDSHAIMIYLVEKYSENNSLYPEDIRIRATINQRLHFDTNSAIVRAAAIRPLFHEGKSEVPENLKTMITEHYEFLEYTLKNCDWLAGSVVTLADLSLIPSITTSNIVVPVSDERFPKLTAWLKRAETLHYYEVNRNGHDCLKELILERLAT